MNIVHRDVKGANILITEGGEIKIGTSVALHAHPHAVIGAAL